MAEALVSGLMDQLEGKQEYYELTRILGAIQGPLKYAERRQVIRNDTRLWLHNLKDVCWDMEDVLDEWSTAIRKLEIQREEKRTNPALASTSSKVSFSMLRPCFCFSSKQIVCPRDIATKMKPLRERLSVIDIEGRRVTATPRDYFSRDDFTIIENPKLEVTPFHEESAIYGREEEMKVLIQKLLDESNEGRGPDVIHIVGMGGMGKTTLAQLAYEDERVKANFDLGIWVCVSNYFDVKKIAQSILGAILGHQTVVESEDLLERIHMHISGKKFLLVLDDVWNEDFYKWELLKQPFRYGSAGSKIVVTTRNEVVASTMETNTMITLRTLSEGDCWLLFSQIAFRGRNANECKQLEQIGREIARKCRGLPIAAKTLGSLMRLKRSRQWEYVLHSETWNLGIDNKNIFGPLLFSYYAMCPALKRCFVYCAVFPKDYVIERDDLVKLWMSKGYLHSKGNSEKEIGQKYFMDLANLSFFQDFERDYRGSIIRCKMHDLVHDLAQFLIKFECFMIEIDGVTEQTHPLTERVRHSTFVLASGAAFSPSTSPAKSLRTLLILGSPNTTINPDIFLHLKCLRTLNLSGCWFKELAEKVSEFLHLRYLNLSGNYELERLLM